MRAVWQNRTALEIIIQVAEFFRHLTQNFGPRPVLWHFDSIFWSENFNSIQDFEFDLSFDILAKTKIACAAF